jgi:hypothetical protein
MSSHHSMSCIRFNFFIIPNFTGGRGGRQGFSQTQFWRAGEGRLSRGGSGSPWPSSVGGDPPPGSRKSAPERGTIQVKEEQFKWEHLGDAWPLIKYASRLVYIMSLIICMIVVRKCSKKFVHS